MKATEQKFPGPFLATLHTIYRTEDVKGYPAGDPDRFRNKSEGRIYIAYAGGEAKTAAAINPAAVLYGQDECRLYEAALE